MSEEISRAEMIKLLEAQCDYGREYSCSRENTTFVKELSKLMQDNDIHGVKYMCMHGKYQSRKSWLFVFPETTDMDKWDDIIHKEYPEMTLEDALYMDLLNKSVQVKCRME